MKISSSRCTTITNGIITSSVQRSKSLSKPISIIRNPSPPPSSLFPQIESTTKDQIIIRKHRHEEKNSIR
jgi:hypothetical protein